MELANHLKRVYILHLEGAKNMYISVQLFHPRAHPSKCMTKRADNHSKHIHEAWAQVENIQ